MHLHNGLHDGQPQATGVTGLAECRIAAVEAVKQARQVLGGDGLPGLLTRISMWPSRAWLVMRTALLAWP